MNFKEQLLEINKVITNQEKPLTNPKEPKLNKNINNKESSKRDKPKYSKQQKLPAKKWGSIEQALNKMFREGDKIEVFSGANKIDNVGSFIAATNNYLIWTNDQGNIVFQHIGGTLSIRKKGGKRSNNKKKNKEKCTSTSRVKPQNEKNQQVMEEILKDVEEIKTDVHSSLNSKSEVKESPSPNKQP